jgi:hypothetical protein
MEIYATDDSGGVRPDFCPGLQQLRVLILRGAFSEDSLPDYLTAFSHLSRLERLSLSNTEAGNGELLPADDLAMYATLLPPSPQLTFLEISWGFEATEPLLAYGCGPYLFPAGWQLPQLKQLVLGVHVDGYANYVDGMTECECFGAGYYIDADAEDDDFNHGVYSNDLDKTVRCCPGLERLSIPGLVLQGVSMMLLLQLTTLSDLCIGGRVVDDDVAHIVLAQLTKLQRLEVYCAPDFSDEGLLALTALRQLTQLLVGRCGTSMHVSTDDAQPGCLDIEQKVRGEVQLLVAGLKWQCLVCWDSWHSWLQRVVAPATLSCCFTDTANMSFRRRTMTFKTQLQPALVAVSL